MPTLNSEFQMQEMYMKIIEEQAAAAKKRIKKKEDKPRYEYDSDEDIDGGTWEHKKRMKEMEKTRGMILNRIQCSILL